MKLKKFLKAVQAKCASVGDCSEGKCPFAVKHETYTACAVGQDGIPEEWDIKLILKAAKHLK